MPNLFYILVIFGILNIGFYPTDKINTSRTSCSIVDVLEVRSLPANSYAVTGFGSYEKASEVIVPINFDAGIYSERLTRKSDNLYKVDGVNLYIKTSMCFEFAYSKEAIIEIKRYGGEVTFK